jgi:ABC-2 type transport system permease protein
MPGVQRIQGYDLRGMLAYQVWVMLVAFLSQGYNAMSLAEDIRLGRISSFLVYPFELWQFHTAGFLAFQVVQLAVAAITLAVTWGLGLLLLPSASHLGAGLCLAALGGAFWFLAAYTMGLAAFWMEETWVLRVIFAVVSSFLSGAILPLELYPDWVRGLLAATPFPYITYVPVKVLMGAHPGGLLAPAAVLLAWILVAAALAAFVWRRGVRLYTAAGM